jgi:soluble lytic murein transglycosylase-like protein
MAVVGALALAGPAAAAATPSVAALQVALRAQGLYAGPIDGLDGPQTKAGLMALHRRAGIVCDGTVDDRTRAALGRLGRPLLGQRELAAGAAGWDVASLEFQLVRHGLPARAVDGLFDARTTAALRRFQRSHGLTADGIAGAATFRALGGTSTGRATQRPEKPAAAPLTIHRVRPGESFFSIGQLYRVSPLELARRNALSLAAVIVPGQRLRLPARAQVLRSPSAPSSAPTSASVGAPASTDAVRAALDRWSARYGVDPKLARAVAWMESGFRQEVVSSAGAIGVMQLLPATWAWVDTLIGSPTPRTYEGNVQAGVRLLRWLLDDFDGNTRLALAGYYQGARAVRERGLFDDTKQYVSVVLRLYGTV